MVATGVWAFQNLKLEAYPDISDPGVVVITQYSGFAAEEVERQVTVPIERALNSTPNVIGRRSRTIFGLSVVELTFSDDTNDYFARQLVLERLRDAELPDGVTPTLGPLSSGIGELFRYVVEGPGDDAVQLRELQDWVVVPRLLQVEGVADVVTFGGLVRQYQIEVDPGALDKYRFSVRQLADAVKNNNRNAGGALLQLGQQALPIRGAGVIQSTEDVESIVLDAPKGVPVFVRDIGRVRMGAQPQTGFFGLNAHATPAGGVEGIVLLRRWRNPSDVLAGLHEAVDELNHGGLPRGVRLVPIYDRTELVSHTLHTVGRVLLEGFLVVTGVLVLLLLSVRAALLVAVVIPLSLLFALGCMYLSGVSLSLLSIGALDFGIIVDATLVMVERMLHRLAEDGDGLADPSVLGRIRQAAHDVQRPILFSLSIIIAAYIPLLTLERVERRLFTPMALTVCYALLGSLLLTLTLVPALATLVFRGGGGLRRHRVLDGLRAGYARLLRPVMRAPGVTVALATLLVGGSLLLGTRLGTEFLPQLDEGVIWIRANLPAGISLEKSAAIAHQVRTLISKSPEVKLVMSQSGRNESGTDPFGPNRNEFLVDLQPYPTWTSRKSKADLVEELSHRLESGVPGASFNFTQPIIDTSTEIATGSSADLAVILSGPDLGQLRALAGRALAATRSLRGAVDTSIEQEADQAQLLIQINRHQVARYGINVSDVQEVIDLAIGGTPITAVFEGERRFDVVARFRPEARADADAIGRLLIPTRDGARVPLAQLASIRAIEGATIIARRENQRQMTVRTNIRGRDQGGFVAEAQTRFAQAVDLPPGYRVSWGGQFENFERARRRLTVILPVTIGIIFALLFMTFGSSRDALLVLLNVPLSLAGGLVALYVRSMNLNVSAVVGFISLFGVAVMSGVLFVAEARRRRLAADRPLADSALEAAIVQFRPNLLLITVAMLGMVPAAIAAGIGSDIQRPLATVVVGGLLSTVLLTPLVLPAGYVLAHRAWRSPRAR